MIKDKDLKELIQAGVIDDAIAERVRIYYDENPVDNKRRLNIIFSILGALLIGLGVIQLIAHNWDHFSTFVKVSIAMIPLIIGQAFCGMVLYYPKLSSWRESAASFLVMSLGASISLVSQTYHMDGSLSAFMISWIIPTLPIIYVMRSSMASVLYVIGCGIYVISLEAVEDPLIVLLIYLGLLIPMLPSYVTEIKRDLQGNFSILLQGVMAVIFLVVLFAAYNDLSFVWSGPIFISAFSSIYILGLNSEKASAKNKYSVYRVLGSLGTIMILFVLSSNFYWKEFDKAVGPFVGITYHPGFIGLTIFMAISIILLVRMQKQGVRVRNLSPLVYSPMIYIPLIFLSIYLPIGKFFTNLLLLWIGLFYILEGAKKDIAQLTSYGLLILFIWTQIRLFDMRMDLILKGVIFILLGVAFISANIWLSKAVKGGKS
ncbi:DUF2157 domain-containing protein [Prolixibacteraceae bacterium]|nr:DUF2157 domain-containing protein [Prolixibacteraceae bacterium]